MKLHKIVTATGLVMLIGCISACGTVSSSGSAATDKSMDVAAKSDTPDSKESVAEAESTSGATQVLSSATPLWKSTDSSRTKSVVISDLHLGVDDSFSEDVTNKPILIDFLKRLEVSSDVKELVIAGDFLDEWYLPMNYAAYSDSDAFYQKVITNNQDVIDELANVMKSGIQLVYAPGNHDMLLSSGILDKALPGIVQARDADGLGVYYTGNSQNVAIEHGHRYDVFSAPDSYSNKDLTNGEKTILPPGYYYARYAASWVTEGRPSNEMNYPKIDTVPDKSDTDQYGAYMYYYVLNSEFNRMTPNEKYTDKTFNMDIDGLHGSYSVADMFPVMQNDGTISAPVLYKNFQRTWEERQKDNLVSVPASFATSVAGATGSEFLRTQAQVQYLENKDKKIDVVVFGHTHIPDYLKLKDGKEYINSGTWVDHNTSCPDKTTRTFVVINSSSTATDALLYEYGEDGTVTDISQSMIR